MSQIVQDFRIINQSLSESRAFQPEVPANLGYIGELKLAGVGQTILGTFVAGLSPQGLVTYLLLNKIANVSFLPLQGDARRVVEQLKFKPSPSSKKASIILGFSVQCLEQGNKTIDILIKTGMTSNAAYATEKELGNWDPTHSLYQDGIGFQIKPTDTSLTNINPIGVYPKTDHNQVSYSNSFSWSLNGGFSSGSSSNVNPRASIRETISSSRSVSDFNILKESDAASDGIIWSSNMKNVYVGNQGFSYDVNNPYDLVINGAFTKWLKKPSDRALYDMDLSLSATYTSVDSSIRDKGIEFEFLATQQLTHVEILHRWGTSLDRKGGIAFSLPYVNSIKGKIAIDFQRKIAKLKEISQISMNYPTMLKQAGIL